MVLSHNDKIYQIGAREPSVGLKHLSRHHWPQPHLELFLLRNTFPILDTGWCRILAWPISPSIRVLPNELHLWVTPVRHYMARIAKLEAHIWCAVYTPSTHFVLHYVMCNLRHDCCVPEYPFIQQLGHSPLKLNSLDSSNHPQLCKAEPQRPNTPILYRTVRHVEFHAIDSKNRWEKLPWLEDRPIVRSPYPPFHGAAAIYHS